MFPDYGPDELQLLARIQALELRSQQLRQVVERPLLERWAQLLARPQLQPSAELKGLLRGGVPPEYRRRLWSWMVQVRTRSVREHEPDHYQQVG